MHDPLSRPGAFLSTPAAVSAVAAALVVVWALCDCPAFPVAILRALLRL